VLGAELGAWGKRHVMGSATLLDREQGLGNVSRRIRRLFFKVGFGVASRVRKSIVEEWPTTRPQFSGYIRA